jgi:Methyltransferase domain
MRLGKMEVANILASFRGYTSYLEICTPTTVGDFPLLDSARFTKVHRLVYSASDQFDDGGPIELRSRTLDIEPCVAELDRRGARYDMILVDPHHDYECSYRDIALGLRLLSDNGAVVIHDVLPPRNGEIISPTFVPDAWCGLTFIAYVDFLMNENPNFFTIEGDYGCGVIGKGRQDDIFAPFREDWQNAKMDHEQAFRYLSRHKHTLLNLQTDRDFLREYDSPATRAYTAGRHRRRIVRRVRRLWDAWSAGGAAAR